MMEKSGLDIFNIRLRTVTKSDLFKLKDFPGRRKRPKDMRVELVRT